MSSLQEIRRRLLLPVAGAGLALLYLVGFLPLAHRAASLDAPLNTAWRKLANSLEQTNALALDFQHITNQLSETRQALAVLEETKKKVATRLELPESLRSKLTSPFQLVDYQNERSKQIDSLDQQAKQQKVDIDPAVYSGFPEHTVDIRDPALLWPALALTHDLLDTAVRSKVSAIHSLEVALDLTNSPPLDNIGRWSEIPLQVEFTGSGDSVSKMIESLPLRGDEMAGAGLPEAPPDKTPLFIHRLIIRKQTPEKLDEVRVWVRVVGFVLRE
jgi:hypothetical protein